jgi:outer membrane protein assembly factor BamB
MGSKVLRRPRSAIGLTAVMFACACIATAETVVIPHPQIAASSPSGLSLIWQDRLLRPISQPVAIGTVVVGINAKDRKLFVVALEPATGRILWQQPLTPSASALGVTVHFTKLGDDKVAYLRPTLADTFFAKLVVADVHTGNDLAVSPEMLFVSTPIVCPNGKDVCASSRKNTWSNVGNYRLDVAGRAYREDNDWLPPGTRLLDDTGLLDLGDRPGNTLGLLRDRNFLWTTPLAAAFPRGFSSDYGWEWRRYAEQHVLVGNMFAPTTRIDGVRAHDPASGSATAGLSERSGQVLWRDLGSGFDCNLDNPDYPVRCRTRGTILIHDDDSYSTRDLDVTVEGFDPATGRTTWSVPMGAANALTVSARPAIAGPTQVLLDGPSGPVVLDYATGHAEPPAANATFWCMTTMHYDFSPPHEAPRGGWLGTTRYGWTYKRRGGELASLCDDQRRGAIALPSIAATMAAGAHIGSYAIIATADGYLGFQAPPP